LAHTLSAGATRIGTAGFKADGLYVTAAENPDGTFGVVLLNDTDTAIKLVLEDPNNSFPLTVPPKGITSCRWKK
jgi:glucosylceramidase